MSPDTKSVQQEDNPQIITDYKINIQIIAFIVALIVIISTLINFIQIYSEEKTRILREMSTEATLLKTVIESRLNYSKYFIKLIGKSVRRNPSDLVYIKNTLQNDFQSQEFNLLFGWRKYSWIDNNFQEVVTSNNGIEKEPKIANLVKEVIDREILKENSNNIIFGFSKNPNKALSFKLIDAIFDNKTNEFLGAVVLSYDINTMIKSLNDHKKNDDVHFVMINDELEVIAKSRPDIDKIITKNNVLSSNLLNVLKELNFNSLPNKEFAYLDMIQGVNYFIKPLIGSSFTIIVNIDNESIKSTIFASVTKKVIEASIFALFCLIIIVSIYKRETSLRTKAEKATILANNAVKAKTNFLSFTAHEIRSPLGFVLTGAELMSKELLGPIPSNYSKYVDGIHKNAQIILEFITDILDENQILEGEFKIVNSINSIEEIISQVVKFNTGKKNISIFTKFQKNLPSLICDKKRMTQVIDNLVSNAIKYSNDGSRIFITVAVEDKSMIISVADEGIGIKEKDIPVALSKYGTLNRNDYTKGGSYGLGLAIVKMLLDAHSAVFEMHSISGKGTTAKIIFPKSKIIYSKKNIEEEKIKKIKE